MSLGYSHCLKDKRGAHIKYYTSKDDNFNVDEVYATFNKKNTLRGFHGSKNQRKKIKVLNGAIRLILIDFNDKTLKVFERVDNESDPVFVDINCFVGYLSLEDDTVVSYVVNGSFNPDNELTYNPLSVPDLWNYDGFNIEKDNYNISNKDLQAAYCPEIEEMRISFQ